MREREAAVFLSRCEPVRVWFAWHPRCTRAARLARAATADIAGFGADARSGLPVYFATSEGDDPPTVDPGGATTPEWTLLVPLLDDHFLAAARWRDWLIAQRSRLASKGSLLPVALSEHAHAMPGLNDLGLFTPRPERPDPDPDVRLDQIVAEVVKRLVLTLADRLAAGPLQVFVSHAKADGRAIALALRDRIASRHRLAFFFDEHDLPDGEVFGARLDAATKRVPAMVAVQTSRYAERPWCRRELAVYRRPVRAPERDKEGETWHLRTLVVVDAIDARPTRVLSEVGGAPLLRWRADGADDVLDRLMREVVFDAWHARLARRVSAVLPEEVRKDPRVVVIDWVPDPYTLSGVRSALGPAADDARLLLYPGDRLGRVELEALRAAVPDMTLMTFGEALARSWKEPVDLGEVITRLAAQPDRTIPADPDQRPVVALSVGDPPNRDLVARGIGSDHVDAILLRIGRLLIEKRVDIAYGGRLDHGFTSVLRDLFRAEKPVADAGGRPLAATPHRHQLPAHPMFIHPVCHPQQITPTRIAADLGLVRHVDFGSAPDVPDGVPADAPWLRALALREMRRAMHRQMDAADGLPVRAPCARIVLGGKLSGYSGFVPGIPQEALCALEAGVPIFVLGLVGGAAAALGQVLFDPLLDPDAIAARLDPDRARTDQAFGVGGEAGRTGKDGPLEADRQALDTLRAAWPELQTADHETVLNNGLTLAENRELFEATDLDTVIRLLDRGLTALLDRAPR